MEKKFNAGDRVMCTDNGKIGVVTEIDNDGFGCVVLFDDGEDTWIGCDMLELSEEPPYDPKTAFLSELKKLMDKYHARFEVNFTSQATYLIIGKERYPYLVPKWIEKG
jgi:hypothetical protein